MLVSSGAHAPDTRELDSIPRTTVRSSVCSPPSDLAGRIRTVVHLPPLFSTSLRMFPCPASASLVSWESSELLLPCWIRVYADSVLVCFVHIHVLFFFFLFKLKSILTNDMYNFEDLLRLMLVTIGETLPPCSWANGHFHVEAPWSKMWSSSAALCAPEVPRTHVYMTNYCFIRFVMLCTFCDPLGTRLQLPTFTTML